ncbi:hypothetical protein IE4803_PB00477 (plasmid) [Rhizobium etli bv. phaseoli str. IE4803]|nr:hypothetical protein IE4803_PB00477 [Rhizobium etli bv. phaseoli str. IE4803]
MRLRCGMLRTYNSVYERRGNRLRHIYFWYRRCCAAAKTALAPDPSTFGRGRDFAWVDLMLVRSATFDGEDSWLFTWWINAIQTINFTKPRDVIKHLDYELGTP